MAANAGSESAGSGDAPALRFAGVSFAYPGAARPALEAVDLDVGRGELVALAGGNGSGKSTLARLSNGLLLPGEGTVTVAGIPTDDHARIWEVRSRVGLLFQNPDDQIVGATVADDVAFGLENLGVPGPELRRRVDATLNDLGLAEEADTEPHLLSGGQRQRVALAGVLVLRPAVLVLDEPTSSLDPSGREEARRLVDAVRAQGVGVLLITQQMDEVLDAERLYVLDRGRLAYAGPPDRFFRSGGDAGLPLLPPPALELWRELDPSSTEAPLTEDELVAALAAERPRSAARGPE